MSDWEGNKHKQREWFLKKGHCQKNLKAELNCRICKKILSCLLGTTAQECFVSICWLSRNWCVDGWKCFPAYSCVTADSAHDSITWCSTDFRFQQVRVTPGFENALQTHHSQCLNPLCSQRTLLKGLRDEKGNTHDSTICLVAVSGACWFACELFWTTGQIFGVRLMQVFIGLSCHLS